MEIITIVTGVLQTNTYLLISDSGKEAVIVDPTADFIGIVHEIEERQVNLKAILVTHGHFDHIGEVDRLRNYFKVPVYTHEEEAQMMLDETKNLSYQFFNKKIIAHTDIFVKDQEVINLGSGFEFICIVVSGHTPNSICYYFPKDGFVLTGDTLMAGAIGRTDFNQTSPSEIIKNIKDNLFILPDNTDVYPGHGYPTEIKIEKESNPYF